MPLTLKRIRKQKAEQERQEVPKGFAAWECDTNITLDVNLYSEIKAMQKAASFFTPYFRGTATFIWIYFKSFSHRLNWIKVKPVLFSGKRMNTDHFMNIKADLSYIGPVFSCLRAFSEGKRAQVYVMAKLKVQQIAYLQTCSLLAFSWSIRNTVSKGEKIKAQMVAFS